MATSISQNVVTYLPLTVGYYNKICICALHGLYKYQLRCRVTDVTIALKVSFLFCLIC